MGKVSMIVIALVCLQGIICGAVSHEEDQEQALNAIVNSANEFSFDLFENLAKIKQRENMVVSPMSSLLVLLMAYQGAEGKTAAEMQKVMHLSKDVLSVSATQQLIDSLNEGSNLVDLHMANKIFVNKAFKVRDTYEKLLDVYFRSSSESLSFENLQQVVDKINNYSKEQTKNRVERIISTDDLNQSTAMVLVNALYFQGNWSKAFDHRKTQKLPFHDGVKEQLVPTMRKKSKFVTGKLPQAHAKFIQLPYQDDDLSMLIVIPDKGHDVSSVLSEISNMRNKKEILAHGESQQVLLDLPKFKFDTATTLNDVLNKMGMVDAFTSHANFSKISEDPVFISKVVQKSLIEVNEQGSEAAAVTGIVGHRINVPSMSSNTVVEFKVDRPFLFSILYKEIVLFIGQVFQPETMNH